MTTFKYDSGLVKREIVRWVAIGRLPLSLHTNHSFVRLVQVVIEPAYKGFPRTSLGRETPSSFQEEKNSLAAIFKFIPSKFLLTCDSWIAVSSEDPFVQYMSLGR